MSDGPQDHAELHKRVATGGGTTLMCRRGALQAFGPFSDARA